METKNVLGLEFIDGDATHLVNEVADFVASPLAEQRYIVTPNPEILLKSWRNPEFAEVLQEAYWRIPDGFGLQWADRFSKRLGHLPKLLRLLLVYPSVLWFGIWRPKKGIINRIAGVDMMEKLLIWQDKLPVFLLGAAPGVAEGVVKQFPYSNVVGTYSGSPKLEFDSVLVDKISESGAKVLFVAFGAPAQEQWIQRNLPKLESVKVAMAVGGSFDYLAGVVGRAPLLWRRLGMEWLYRLIKQPSRWKRIWRAVVVFPWWVAKR